LFLRPLTHFPSAIRFKYYLVEMGLRNNNN
jgi:hypothetical protein